MYDKIQYKLKKKKAKKKKKFQILYQVQGIFSQDILFLI